MEQIKIVETKGFTKDEALSEVNFNATFKNATQAWVKAGSPAFGTTNFKTFAAEYLKKSTKNAAGLGAHVVLESGVADSRERPYKVLTVTGKGTRKFKRQYQIVEAELEKKIVKTTDEDGKVSEELTVKKVLSLGAVVASADQKGDAEKILKEWITSEKRDYIIQIVSVVVEGEPIASYGLYTPSVSAKKGTYVAFGIEA